MTIAILDPDSGNITSICDALERLKRPYRVLKEPDLDGIDQILLPGQGRFGSVMHFIRRNGWATPLRDWAAHQKPILGICVGMQILFESSEEDPGMEGLGIFKGRITKLESPKQPMIGWARVHWLAGGFRNGAAYFVNSYVVKGHPNALAVTEYGNRFCSVVACDNIYAFQFHPEKSGQWGKELLEQCLIY